MFREHASGLNGAYVDVDTLHEDQYYKPFTTRRIRSPILGGGLKQTDLIQRFGLRGIQRTGLLASLVLPSVRYGHVYDECRISKGLNHQQAHEIAYAAAHEELDRSRDYERFYPKAQADWGRLTERIQMQQDPVPTPENQGLHPGASGPRPGGVQETPGKVKISGTGTSPHATSAAQRTPRTQAGVEAEFMTFRAADGKDYSFLRKEGGVPHPQLLPLVALMAAIEIENGGSAKAVAAAAGITLEDVHGETFFSHVEWVEQNAPAAPSALPTGVSVS